MTFRSCDGHRVDLPLDGSRWTALIEAGEGSFAYGELIDGDETYYTVMIHMPYTAKHESVHMLRIYQDGEPRPKEPAWTWDGNRDTPTLSPSIACGMPKGSDWHGYMTAGRLEACE